MRPFILSAALCGLIACKGGGDAPPAPLPPEAPASAAPSAAEPAAPAEPAPAAAAAVPSEQPTPVQALMRGHFQQAGEAREALLRADMEGARKAMQWLATHALGDMLPENLRPLLQAMQSAAGTFGDAKTLREAGVALANTLTKCGACHTATGKGPTFAVPPLPAGEDAAHHMQRHHWAAERMWEGLVKNDAEAFDAAAEALSESAIDPKRLEAPPHTEKTVRELSEHVHDLGKQAKAATDAESRGRVYGNFLATCAACHRMLGRGPKPVDAPAEPVQ